MSRSRAADGEALPRAGLSRASVTEIASSLIDQPGSLGFQGLTLAAVGAHAGVAVPSLYKHVRSLAELKRLVAIDALNAMTREMQRATVGRAGRDALASMADALRAFAHEHPGGYLAGQLSPKLEEHPDEELVVAATASVDTISDVLRGFDVPADAMVDAVRLVRSGLHGFIALELGGGFAMPEDLDQSFRIVVDALSAGVSRLSEPGLPTP